MTSVELKSKKFFQKGNVVRQIDVVAHNNVSYRVRNLNADHPGWSGTVFTTPAAFQLWIAEGAVDVSDIWGGDYD